jgi:hypothetical protein
MNLTRRSTPALRHTMYHFLSYASLLFQSSCISVWQIRISQQLAGATEDYTAATQRDIRDIRKTVHDLLEAFTSYTGGPTLQHSPDPTFRAVVRDIEEVCLPKDSCARDALTHVNRKPLTSNLLLLHPASLQRCACFQ